MKRFALLLLIGCLPLEAASSAQLENWKLEKSEQGCVVHASYRRGTVLSVWAWKDRQELGFVLQNLNWKSVQDDSSYTLDVQFDEATAWQVTASGSKQIDQDGPGIIFPITPGRNAAGENFVAEFAFAKNMHIMRNGEKVESLLLKGSHGAIVALATCIGRVRSLHRDPFAEPDQSEPVDQKRI